MAQDLPPIRNNANPVHQNDYRPVRTWDHWYPDKENFSRLPPSRRRLVERPFYLKQANDLAESRKKRMQQDLQDRSDQKTAFRESQLLNFHSQRSRNYDKQQQVLLGQSKLRYREGSSSALGLFGNPLPVYSTRRSPNTSMGFAHDGGSPHLPRYIPAFTERQVGGISPQDPREIEPEIATSIHQLALFDNKIKMTKRSIQQFQKQAQKGQSQQSSHHSDSVYDEKNPPLPHFQRAERFRQRLRKLEQEQNELPDRNEGT
ncbi:hypothetical protein BLNAU_14375 [Blattamonas nauphoetae]|uniref:Uncharacterized protein n=1 Tax=Blattamonas nauphoetae TaxID=2049346 RepID=A0ABQ9XGA6_9EUKA|nr:hypothetical protein BLNAU_14375 [Blattamonas nauphoetae]